jgi:hypothetical protein
VYVARHALASALVVTSLTVVVGVFVFARPHYRPAVQVRNYDMATRKHFSVQRVLLAFGAQGIHLRYGTRTVDGTRFLFAVPPRRATTAHLNVTVYSPKTKLGWGLTGMRLETVVGNVSVTYDGTRDDVLRRAKAAVAELDEG